VSDQPNYSRLHARALVKIDYERKRADAAEAKLTRYEVLEELLRVQQAAAPQSLSPSLTAALATLDKEKE
jgi:hypothetical protein